MAARSLVLRAVSAVVMAPAVDLAAPMLNSVTAMEFPVVKFQVLPAKALV